MALPEWLAAPKLPTKAKNVTVVAALNHRKYESVFEWVLECISSGMSLQEALENDMSQIDMRPYMTWIHRDEERKARFYKAQEIRADVIADEIVSIADGKNPCGEIMDDVARDRLRIDARKFVLEKQAPARYGEKRTLNITHSIDIDAAYESGMKRIAEHE